MDYPKVSFIIPTFNQARLIDKTLDSILAQDYPNFEVIVSDDASLDFTKEVIDKYLSKYNRIKYFRNKTNIGRVANYKKLLFEYATGEWVVNCDGDDFYNNNAFISDLMKLILENKDRNIVFAQTGQYESRSGNLFHVQPTIDKEYKVFSSIEYFNCFHKIDHFTHLTTLYRRELAIKLDFYRYDIISSDMESLLRMAVHGDVLLVRKIYGTWVEHSQNVSQKVNLPYREKNLIYIKSVMCYAINNGIPISIMKQWQKKEIQHHILTCIALIFKNSRTFSSRILQPFLYFFKCLFSRKVFFFDGSFLYKLSKIWIAGLIR